MNIPEENLDRIIATKDAGLLFTLNGLPDPRKQHIPRNQMLRFLRANLTEKRYLYLKKAGIIPRQTKRKDKKQLELGI